MVLIKLTVLLALCVLGLRVDSGGTLLHSIAGNPAAAPHWLELVCSPPSKLDINHQNSPRNFKWQVIGKAMRTMKRLNISRSDLILDVSHVEGATPLHLAARAGNYKLVQWMLHNGAEGSLHLTNKMRCAPIDIARVCGPHHEVCGLLASAMCAGSAEVPSVAHSASDDLALRIARSGETAISMQYDMWLMPVAEFLKLSELRPHQELRAMGKLVRWNATMKAVFFLSHQWTSFTRPDYSTAQLRTVQRLLTRMIQGRLPTTAPSLTDRMRFPSNVSVASHEWRALAPQAFIWMDFISVRLSYHHN